MQPTRKNYTRKQLEIYSYFQFDVQRLFIGNYNGTKCNTKLAARILLLAACSALSLFHACRTYANFDSHTLANALLKLLPDYVKLQQRINDTLHSQLPKNFCKKARRIAIDLVLIPYHGHHQYNLNEVYRSQPKSGTSHFHAYATACVVHKGHRYTVAVIPVAKGTPMKEVVQALLKQCRSIGLQCSLLLLDRGFYSVETLSYLKHVHQAFLMPLVIRGKQKTKNTPAGGTRRYADCKRQLWDRYELRAIKKVDGDYLVKKTTINICVYCKNMKGKNKKQCRQTCAFVYDGVGEHSARWFYETYRLRFGIESSYRQSHGCRIRTSTRSALLRLLYFALSMFLRNLWISFEREVIFARRNVKQQTSDYFGFADFRDALQKWLAETVPIPKNVKYNMTLVFVRGN